MGLNPQNVRTVKFKTVKKGLDPGAVQEFLASVADNLERAQNHAAAMEARARAAVQRVQELTPDHTSTAEAADTGEDISASVDESETISRTLLLAQRTADTTIADAQAEAEALVEKAAEDATRELDAARELATQMAEAARSNARQIGESERAAADEELRKLLERRAGLSSDVTELEQFLEVQRARLRDAASTLVDLTERIPGGLGKTLAPVPQVAVDDVASDDVASDDLASDDDQGDGGGDDPQPSQDQAGGASVPPGPEPDAADGSDDDTEDLLIVADLTDDADDTGDATPADRQIWPPEDVASPPAESDLHFNFSDDR